MRKIEDYLNWYYDNRELSCRFNLNILGTLVLNDGTVKIVLDEKLDQISVDSILNKDTLVFINRIDEEANTVYVIRSVSVGRKTDSSDNGEEIIYITSVMENEKKEEENIGGQEEIDSKTKDEEGKTETVVDPLIVSKIVEELISHDTDIRNRGGIIRSVVLNHYSEEEITVSLIASIINKLLGESYVDLAYRTFKVFRSVLLLNDNVLINFLSYATGIAKKQGDKELTDSLYIEYYLFLLSKNVNPETPYYIGLFNSAVNYYKSERTYNDILLLFYEFRASNTPIDDDRYYINKAEYYLYKAEYEKSLGLYDKAIDDYRHCKDSAKGISDKSTKNKYVKMSYSRISICEDILKQFPIDKYLLKLDYEGAYKYMLNMHTQNPDNDSITDLFNKIEIIYDRSVTRIDSLPVEAKKGRFFRRATAAEIIEENLPKAELLWRKSINKEERGLLSAIKSYISVLIREKKYILALDKCKEYYEKYTDIIEQFTFRIKAVDILILLGRYEEAVTTAFEIESECKKNKGFVKGGNGNRLALLLSKVAKIQGDELGFYVNANDTLNRALKLNLEKSAYASAYINNCMAIGDYEAVQEVLEKYSDVLSDEYVYSVTKSLQKKSDIQLGEDLALLDTYSSKGNERFFDWFISKNCANCPDEIVNYLEADNLKNVNDLQGKVLMYTGYDNNLSAQIFLNALAAKQILENIDGYSSKAYYSFVAQSLTAENTMRINNQRNNIYLAKYTSIALFNSGNIEHSFGIINQAVSRINNVKSDSKTRTYIAILMSNSPLLKLKKNEVDSEYIKKMMQITASSSYEEFLTTINKWINEYNEKNNVLLESKAELLSSFENDPAKADKMLLEIWDSFPQLLDDDKRHIESLISINRELIKSSRISDYVGKNDGIEKAREKANDTRRMIEEGVTPFCLLLWIDILNKLEKKVEDEQSKINETLAPEITISIDNGANYSKNGRVLLNYSIANEKDCAPAKEVRITFEDNEFEDNNGNPLEYPMDSDVFTLSGGESKSMVQEFDKDCSFSVNIRVSYIDAFGNDSERCFLESVSVNSGDAFEEIKNPFAISSGFDPNDPEKVFVGRNELIKRLKEIFLSNSAGCVVLFGQKKIGKTSILRKLEKELEDDYISCRIMMSPFSDMTGFFKAVVRAFKKKNKSSDSEIISRINNLSDSIEDGFGFLDYITDISEIYGKRVLLMLDEFSSLYDLRETSFPREFMNQWKMYMEEDVFSAIITGQETMYDLMDIFPNHFAGFHREPVDYIKYEYFHDFVDESIKKTDGQSRYKENSFEKLWKWTKGHPYLTQCICIKLVDYMNDNKTEFVYDATIDKVVDLFIQSASKLDFDSFYNRYSDNNTVEYKEEINATLRLLLKFSEECEFSGNGVCDISRLGLSSKESNIISKLVERGVIDIRENSRCEIRVKLFYEWLRKKGKYSFDLQEENEIEPETQSNTEELHSYSQTINNYYGDVNNVNRDFVQNQVNNIDISIKNAVVGLENIQSLVTGNKAIDRNEIENEIALLPFNNSDLWDQLEEEEKEQKTAQYAEQIFNSSAFINEELTDDQKKRFNLSSEVFNMLSPDCQTQIKCGIQVYDLIQYCIDHYGMEMSSSESPRGILFARAFERHMRDCMHNILKDTKGFGDQVLLNRRTLHETQANKVTIGNYAHILENGDYRILVKLAAETLNSNMYDNTWWNDLTDNLKRIGDLRNDCCHSGSDFIHEQLSELIDLIFVKEAIQSVYVFKEMEKGGRNNSITATTRKEEIKPKKRQLPPNYNLIGKKAKFTMQEKKKSRRNIVGVVEDRYLASLPPSEVKTFNLQFEEGKEIEVWIKEIQEGPDGGKYILSLKKP